MTASELALLRARMTDAERAAFDLGQLAGRAQHPPPGFDLDAIKPGMSDADAAAAAKAILAALDLK
jgi:hypothetical protein